MSDSPRAQARRWYLQRISAMVLAILVLVHLVIMVYAVRGGLSGAEILSRTQGNAWLAVYYALFVLACAVHVPTGLANIAVEWARLARITSALDGTRHGAAAVGDRMARGVRGVHRRCYMKQSHGWTQPSPCELLGILGASNFWALHLRIFLADSLHLAGTSIARRQGFG